MDFRTHLKEEFENRHKRNFKYSLRSFAKSLNISHATLSHILRGKRPLTSASIFKLGKALGLKEAQINQFVPDSIGSIDHSQLKFDSLPLPTIEAISDWYHDAILELSKTKFFKPDISWISRVLEISPSKVKRAIKRMVRFGLLEITDNGKWLDKSEFNTTITHCCTTKSLVKLQKQILKLGVKALEKVPYSKRDQSSLVMAIDPADLPKVKEKVKKFRRDLCKFLNRKGIIPEEVYQLGVSFYPLTHVSGVANT